MPKAARKEWYCVKCGGSFEFENYLHSIYQKWQGRKYLIKSAKIENDLSVAIYDATLTV